jgi:nucleoside-triphosphatase THEP1
MKKVFLYGKRHSGKSTIINTLLGELGLRPAGFRTISDSPDFSGDWNLYITGAGERPQLKSKVASCHSDGSWESYSNVFDDAGVKLLTFSGKPQIVIMDELGFMEEHAARFKKRVLEVLDEEHAVLGVIKPAGNGFLQSVIGHPSVMAVEVTEENRNDVLALLKEEFRTLMI